MPFDPPTEVAVGSVLTASKYNQEVVENVIVSPRGYIERANKTNTQTVTTAADLTDLSISVPQITGRAYLYMVTVEAQSTVAGDVYLIELTDATPTTLQRATGRLSGANAAQTMTLIFAEVAGSSATVTRKIRGQRASGSGTMTLGGAAGRPAQIIAMDLGAT